MPTGRETALRELREQELKRAKKIVEVNRKILEAVREEYGRLVAECNDPKTEAAYGDVLDVAIWNYKQSKDWLRELER